MKVIVAIASIPLLMGGSPCFQQFSRPYYVAPQVKYVAPAVQKVVQDRVQVNVQIVGVPVPISYQQPIAQGGSTSYGYSTAAEIYGDVDLPLLFDRAERLASQAQQLSASATSGYLDLAESERSRREKAAEIIAAGQAIRDVLSQTKVSRIQTAGVQTRVEARANVQGVPDVPQPPAETAAQVVNQYCVRCHGQEAPKAGFDITSPQLTAEQWLEVLDRVSSPDPERHMPPAGEPQLTVQERRLLFAYDPEASE